MDEMHSRNKNKKLGKYIHRRIRINRKKTKDKKYIRNTRNNKCTKMKIS